MPVQETQHAPSLPRGVASETPVGRVAVAEDSRNAGKRPVSGRSDTRTCLTDTCGGDGRGRRPIINRSDTRPCHRDACSVGDRVRIGQNYRKVAVLTPACHARWPQRPLWSRMPWQKAVRRPFCHATMALRHLWRGCPWQKKVSRQEGDPKSPVSHPESARSEPGVNPVSQMVRLPSLSVAMLRAGYFCGSGRRSRLSSSSWIWSISEGESIITSRPWLFFGNAMKSRMVSWPPKRAQTRSKPKARPP